MSGDFLVEIGTEELPPKSLDQIGRNILLSLAYVRYEQVGNIVAHSVNDAHCIQNQPLHSHSSDIQLLDFVIRPRAEW